MCWGNTSYSSRQASNLLILLHRSTQTAHGYHPGGKTDFLTAPLVLNQDATFHASFGSLEVHGHIRWVIRTLKYKAIHVWPLSNAHGSS